MQLVALHRRSKCDFVLPHAWKATLAIAVALLAGAFWTGAASPIDDVRRQIVDLRSEIARHDAAYYRDVAPTISDEAYDQLRRRLAALEQQFPEVAKAMPPLAGFGDDRSGLFASTRHREPMLSLEKAYTEAELRSWATRLARRLGREELEFVIEPKFDGLAVSVTYEQGRLVRAVTRGNGREGDDVTRHAQLLPGVPRVLHGNQWPAVVEVRGEVYVPFADFARINRERTAADVAPFANPRNLAAGTLRQLDPQEVVRRGLQAVFYGFGACEPRSMLPATQHELANLFRTWGLPALEHAWPACGAADMCRAVADCRQARPGFPFPTDGAVVKLDSLALQREAGAGEHAPRWAVAFKFAPERAETKLLAITVQVGRTGALTPVAELAPVELGGSTIARATLHNRDEIARRDLRIGDTVYLEKAGEIIPAIVGVNLERRRPEAVPYVFPTTCPECGAPVTTGRSEAVLRCSNARCWAQLRRRVEHFASKGGVDIPGLGPALIDAFVAKELIHDLPDIFRLREEDFWAIGRSPGKSIDQVLAAIDQSKHAELWRFIAALGMPQIGAAAARELAPRVGTLEALANLTAEWAAGSDPPVRAAKAFMSEPRNRALIADLIAAGAKPAEAKVAVPNGAVAGKVFVLTGALPTLTRAQATEKIQRAGGKVSGSVGRTTNFIVVGAEPGAKLEQAKKLGVAAIDEAELMRMLEGK